MAAVSSPCQLLEMNVISAQDLAQVSKSIQAYAVAWVHPERKLTTQIDEVGHTNPTWNEKFVFRVDDEFLNNENSVVMVEIYTATWLRDVLIGTVGVLVSNLLPPSNCNHRNTKLRFVALQIRRPSGRPQGILNVGVTLLDSTMRSMPIYSELSASWDMMESNNKKKKSNPKLEEFDDSEVDSKLMTLQRCQSEKNDSTINDYAYHGAGKQAYGYGYDGGDSELGFRKRGDVLNDESLCNSDVGPSPSVVAAAIANGLYPMPHAPPSAAESSTIDGWSESNGTEMKMKMERWRAELTPAFEDYDEERKKLMQTPKRVGQTPTRPGRRKFSCFGTAFGCEFSITCGAGNRKKRVAIGKGRLTSLSELTFDDSYI
ncbi:uncharacterized protein LOC113862061 [Abrus precatorius]|uniref:Uncharacterized protein LOC113862061 n=1 Tax=Abrus precatorius TaxID=3816 RepID=A0A8B8L487_ABRPR|nr:uncharacterized protein LOC113862061 [Abrus precatorius]